MSYDFQCQVEKEEKDILKSKVRSNYFLVISHYRAIEVHVSQLINQHVLLQSNEY